MSHIPQTRRKGDSILGLLNNDGNTPLHCTAEKGHYECVSLLVRAWPDAVDARNRHFCTPLMLASAVPHEKCVAILRLHSKTMAISDDSEESGDDDDDDYDEEKEYNRRLPKQQQQLQKEKEKHISISSTHNNHSASLIEKHHLNLTKNTSFDEDATFFTPSNANNNKRGATAFSYPLPSDLSDHHRQRQRQPPNNSGTRHSYKNSGVEREREREREE